MPAAPLRQIRSIATSSRPDFAILGYPVITFTETWTHQGSKTALLGASPDAALVASLSNETQVTATTPPTFLFHTNADRTVPAENSVQVLPGTAKSRRPGRVARLPQRWPRRWPGRTGSRTHRMAAPAWQLASRERVFELTKATDGLSPESKGCRASYPEGEA